MSNAATCAEDGSKDRVASSDLREAPWAYTRVVGLNNIGTRLEGVTKKRTRSVEPRQAGIAGRPYRQHRYTPPVPNAAFLFPITGEQGSTNAGETRSGRGWANG